MELFSEQTKEDAARSNKHKLLHSYATYSNTKIPASSLALAGFQYSTYNKKLFCKQCGLQVAADEFTEYVDPLALHFVYSNRKCSYALSLMKRSQAITDHNIILGKFLENIYRLCD